LLSKNLGVHWDSNSLGGSSLGSARVHSFTLPFTPGLPSWPATLQVFALVASPKLRLRHLPTSHHKWLVVDIEQ